MSYGTYLLSPVAGIQSIGTHPPIPYSLGSGARPSTHSTSDSYIALEKFQPGNSPAESGIHGAKMLPPIDDAVLQGNPGFESLYKSLTDNILHPDGSTKKDPSAKKRDEVREVRSATAPGM